MNEKDYEKAMQEIVNLNTKGLLNGTKSVFKSLSSALKYSGISNVAKLAALKLLEKKLAEVCTENQLAAATYIANGTETLHVEIDIEALRKSSEDKQ